MKSGHEWLNTNSLRSYPLTELSNKTSSQGYTVPSDLVVDLALCVPASVTYPCRISTLSFTGRLLSILIQDSTNAVVGITTIDLEEAKVYQSHSVRTAIAVDGGTITLGKGMHTLLNTWPRGNHYFTSAYLEPTTCFPVSVGPVTSLGIYGQTTTLYGDVKLEAGENVKLSYNYDDNSIVIGVVREELFEPVCEPDCNPSKCNLVPIRTINKVQPTEAGCEFFIDGASVVTIDERNSAIVIGSSLRPADFCLNYNQASDGDPGSPGAAGGGGGSGYLVCEPEGCECEPCPEPGTPGASELLTPRYLQVD